MASTTVRVLILAFAFGACLAEIDQSKSVCKFDESKVDISKHVEDANDCLKQIGCEYTIEEIHKNHTILTKEEKEDLSVCMGQKCGFLSEDLAYDVELAKQKTDETFSANTDPTVVTEINAAFDACVQEHDPKTEGVKCMNCCTHAVIKICFGHETPI